MTSTTVHPTPVQAPYRARHAPTGSRFLAMLHTTDPKQIAVLYLVTSFAFFMVGGALALLIRAELARPGLQFLSNEQYNQLFTMHGTIMLLLYATPIVFGFANYIVPLQIGAPDVAFPRLNARRGHPLAAPVLVLRPPRGLHRRATVLRHRHRGLPRLRPQTPVRLHAAL